MQRHSARVSRHACCSSLAFYELLRSYGWSDGVNIASRTCNRLRRVLLDLRLSSFAKIPVRSICSNRPFNRNIHIFSLDTFRITFLALHSGSHNGLEREILISSVH